MRAARLVHWIIPFLLLALFLFCFAAPGYSFSGYLCLGIAAVILCLNLLSLLAKYHPLAEKIIKTVLITCVCIGIVIVGITEVPIIRNARGNASAQVEYIVVLGAGIRGSTPSPILQSRMEAACEYLRAHPDVICIASGGQGPDEDLSEARCISNYLTLQGIDPERIWLEEHSTSTWENFQYTMELIEEKTGSRPEKMGVLTSDFHLYRASLFAGACGIEAVGIPAQTPTLPLQINYYLREAAAIWKYLIFGG